MIKVSTVDAMQGWTVAGFQASVSDEVIQSVIADVLAGAHAFWIKRAGEKLHSTRRDYLEGIQEVEVNGKTGGIALLGLLPNLVEGGMSAYDMHETLLGPNVPVVPAGSGMKGKHARKDGGFWRVIPFRHQTPGTIGQGGGAPMGSAFEGAGSAFAAAIGKTVHNKAQKLKPSLGMPGGKTQWGGRLPEGLAPKLKEKHSTDIYAGMAKLQKKYASATQNTYMTFRIISDGVKDKWLHPGITPANISDDVQAYVDKVAPLAFAALLSGDKK